MSDDPARKTSRFGVLLVVFAVGGSAIGVGGWHLLSNRGAGLDTSGFDMSVEPESRAAARPAAATSYSPDPAPSASLGMVKGDAGITVVSPGASTPKSGSSGGTPASPKEAAVMTFKEAAIKNEKLVDAFVRRMEKKHPSITQYGRDWAASPELRALRDQYWKDRDPLKFAYGMTKSKDFSKLIKKYAGDPGVRDVLITGIKEAPPSLTGAVSGVLQNDSVAKGLVSTVIKAVGLPASLTGFLEGGEAKPASRDQVMADIMNSDDVKKAMQNRPAPVALDQQQGAQPGQEAQPNGFRPLGGR